jgi:hypothetical protein
MREGRLREVMGGGGDMRGEEVGWEKWDEELEKRIRYERLG